MLGEGGAWTDIGSGPSISMPWISASRRILAIAQEMVPEVEELVTRGLSATRVAALRADLERIRARALAAVTEWDS